MKSIEKKLVKSFLRSIKLNYSPKKNN